MTRADTTLFAKKAISRVFFFFRYGVVDRSITARVKRARFDFVETTLKTGKRRAFSLGRLEHVPRGLSSENVNFRSGNVKRGKPNNN